MNIFDLFMVSNFLNFQDYLWILSQRKSLYKLYMNKLISLSIILLTYFGANSQVHKAPAYPLITHDPYFSIWSFSDNINETPTKHWTGKNQSIVGLLKVDANTYSFLGAPEPIYNDIVPSGEITPQAVRYTVDNPVANWYANDFSDETWSSGTSPLSSELNNWTTRDVWVRKYFEGTTASAITKLLLRLRHDDDVEVYLNGESIYSCGPCYKGGYDNLLLGDEVKNKIKPGKNLLAFHCTNTGGPGFIDAGLVNEVPSTGVLKAKQTRIEVTATQTKYHLTCGPVNIEVTFISPLLAESLDILSRPISYLVLKESANDQKEHDVQLYVGLSSSIATDNPFQEATASVQVGASKTTIKAGTTSQEVLNRKGDDVRIDWGYLYLSVASDHFPWKQDISLEESRQGYFEQSGQNFLKGKRLRLNSRLGLKVRPQPAEQVLLIGYDDIESVKYFDQNLKAWWKKTGTQSIKHCSMLKPTFIIFGNDALTLIRE